MTTKTVMEVRPISIHGAKNFVAQYHRHSDPPGSALFALALTYEGLPIGVAIVGRPKARRLQDGLTAEVVRCCVLPTAPKGACSKLYARCAMIWKAMGGVRLVTYTLQAESGASLRGANWLPCAWLPGCKRGWNCQARPRKHRRIYEEAKTRWEAPLTAWAARAAG